MCMEDIRLGRQKFSRASTYTCDGTGLAVIPSDPKRVAVTISGNGVNSTFISDKAITAADPGLLVCAAGTVRPYTFRVEDIGEFVYGQIFVSIAAGVIFSVIETSLTKE